VIKRIKGKKADIERELRDLDDILLNVGKDVLGEKIVMRRDELEDELQVRGLPRDMQKHYPDAASPREKKLREQMVHRKLGRASPEKVLGKPK